MSRKLARRDFFKMTGGALAVAAGARWLPTYLRKTLSPIEVGVANAQDADIDLFLGGTDGWIYLPPTPEIPPFHPDNLAPAPLTTYIFGFRNLTGLDPTNPADYQLISNQKNKAQHSAPLFWTHQNTPFRVQLTNLGLALRPDLFDAHTVHWHGFRNVIPFFDGEPSSSVSVPTGRYFTYVYHAHEPGTYMYHCHVEDVEHVHMGMTGMVFVRPEQDGTPYTYGGRTFTKFVYNDADGSTGYDREFSMFLSEVWAEAHWADAHIQLPEWSDYRADFTMLNGRVYPDTIAPNGSIDPFNPVRDASGDLIPTPGYEHLQYQPISSLVRCNAGEHVLLRFANLGFKEASMTLTGIPMRVIGKDATPMRGRDGTDTSYETETLSFNAGESIDAIFTAPAHSGGTGPDKYLLYNRRYTNANNRAPGGFGGQATEVHVYPTGALDTQQYPNDWANLL
ncbi:MAG: multicopper oxidase domain-containing protein [Caldilineaceae bacterium]